MRKIIPFLALALFRCSSPEGEPGSSQQAIIDGTAEPELDGIAFWQSYHGNCGAPIWLTFPDEGYG